MPSTWPRSIRSSSSSEGSARRADSIRTQSSCSSWTTTSRSRRRSDGSAWGSLRTGSTGCCAGPTRGRSSLSDRTPSLSRTRTAGRSCTSGCATTRSRPRATLSPARESIAKHFGPDSPHYERDIAAFAALYDRVRGRQHDQGQEGALGEAAHRRSRRDRLHSRQHGQPVRPAHVPHRRRRHGRAGVVRHRHYLPWPRTTPRTCCTAATSAARLACRAS